MATKPDSANRTTPLLKMKGLGGGDSTAEDHKSKGWKGTLGKDTVWILQEIAATTSQSSTRKKKYAARYRD